MASASMDDRDGMSSKGILLFGFINSLLSFILLELLLVLLLMIISLYTCAAVALLINYLSTSLLLIVRTFSLSNCNRFSRRAPCINTQQCLYHHFTEIKCEWFSFVFLQSSFLHMVSEQEKMVPSGFIFSSAIIMISSIVHS